MSTPVVGLIEAVIVGFRLSIDMAAFALSLPPSASVAVTEHWILSVGDATALLKLRLSLVPNADEVDALVHSYVNVGVPPSGSVAVATQDNVVSLNTLVAGRISTLVTVGAVLSMVTDTLSVAVPEYPSVAVVVQVTVSPGLAMVRSRVKLAVVPTRVVPTNQA